MITKLRFLFILFIVTKASAQIPDHVYQPNIHSVKLYRVGDIYSYPVLNLNSGDQLELHFDDMGNDIKNYYYSFILCNADWSISDLRYYDYITGFQSVRITTYRNSSIVPTRYVHYTATFPDRNSNLTKSGNYLLVVFQDDDMKKIIFTKRMLVVDNKATVGATVLQPSNQQIFRTYQRLNISVSTANARINTLSPQDIKVVAIQNGVWSGALLLNRPDIFRGNYFEYSDEDNTVFPAGKEWRWVDLRSLQLKSDRVRSIIDTSKRVEVYMKPDNERNSQAYVFYRDFDGIYTIENEDGNNPFWQSDYAYTHFTYAPPGGRPYDGKSLYLFGELTNYITDDNSKMIFNPEKGVYEGTLYLKQGYYNYTYVTVPDRTTQGNLLSIENTEGDYWQTENNYMILVYYRGFGARYDELIGFTRMNSPFQQ